MARKDDIPVDQSALLTEAEAAAFLRLSTRTLQKLAQQGAGPARVRLTVKSIAYRRADLEAWIASRPLAKAAA